MNKSCMNCAYGGSCFPKYNNVVPCKNDNVKKKELLYDCRPYRNETTKEMVVENNTAETCEYFIPRIDKLLETLEKNAEKYLEETNKQKFNAYFDIKVAKMFTQNELKRLYHDNRDIIFMDNKNLRAYKLTKDGELVLI